MITTSNEGTIQVEGMILAPHSGLGSKGGTLTANRLVIDRINGRRNATIRIGDSTPHPIDLLLVK